MSNFANKFYFEPLRSIAFGAISSSYAPVGAPLSDTARKVKFVNTTNAGVMLSLDGVTDHDYIPSNGFALYDLVDSSNIDQQKPEIPLGTQFYVKGTPSSGTFYIVVTGAQ
jgi:hypothetical protein